MMDPAEARPEVPRASFQRDVFGGGSWVDRGGFNGYAVAGCIGPITAAIEHRIGLHARNHPRERETPVKSDDPDPLLPVHRPRLRHPHV